MRHHAEMLDGIGGERLLSTDRPDAAMIHHQPRTDRYRERLRARVETLQRPTCTLQPS